MMAQPPPHIPLTAVGDPNVLVCYELRWWVVGGGGGGGNSSPCYSSSLLLLPLGDDEGH